MRIPDRYYGLHPAFAWLISLVMAGFGLMVTFAVFEVDDSLGFFGDMLGLLLIAPLLMFLWTPFIRVAGWYKYYSPLFLVFGESKTRIEIHSGPSVDYLLHLRGIPPGKELQRTVLAFYLQGLLNIADKVASSEDPATVEIVGTSYFFSDRSVERMGFQVSPGGWLHRINLVFSFLELFLLNSLSAGKVKVPNIFKVKKASMSGERLLEHREYIQRLYDRMATERNRAWE
ncbi:hypothetical protein [Neolewinella agarilytica]|uniref:Uncharacterized protein n=1 Tax=Neolewinella agarilytica TaxID=478744 RepID=A0A1H9F8L7_9BACT|nr:hypothetical protein [Neolewinella agarilytica]SEQ34290.1 hypothetical protein SAMN05444359_108131 [Neolewinella agarilytica]